MELILKDLTYKGIKYNDYLNNINYTFLNGITFLSGIDIISLKSILFMEEKSISGYVMVSEEATRTSVSVVSMSEAFVKTTFLEEANYYNEYYGLCINDVLKRVNDSLVMVGLNINYANRNFNTLGTSAIKKIKLALALFLNSKIIMLDNFEKEMISKDIVYFKKLFRKLAHMYNKTIIISSNEIDNYIDLIDNYVIFNGGKLVCCGDKKDLYNDTIYQYIKMPDIINFIKELKANGHVFDEYVETKELLKAIYRDVENEIFN